MTFPDQAYKRLNASFETFLQQTELHEALNTARDFVRARYEASIANMGSGFHGNYPDMMRIFHGVHIPEVIERFTRFRAKKVSRQPKRVDIIREYAKDAAKQNIDEAVELMRKAYELRPKGPQIKDKLAEYEALQQAAESAVKSTIGK